ncbi:MAG: hypothetical protein JRF72_01545 [Deltaproteobacteria bacterium]|jgi:hypothetical protein|nr:hypothetical protein [Deltaproteobacteria bacterium]
MVAILSSLYLLADSFLIFFYRITGMPLVDYFMGTFFIAFLCVVVGELSVSLALGFNQRYIDEMNSEMETKEKLSIAAYRSGDRASYRALNRQATDVWGKQFFTMVAYSAGILWPIPCALGWMQTRFADVQFALAFPLSLVFGKEVGYTFVFIPLYIFCRILFKYIRPFLPYFKGVQNALDRHAATRPSEMP